MRLHLLHLSLAAEALLPAVTCSDAIALLPKLTTGIDVNVRFHSITEGFEYTPETVRLFWVGCRQWAGGIQQARQLRMAAPTHLPSAARLPAPSICLPASPTTADCFLPVASALMPASLLPADLALPTAAGCL